MGEHLEIEQKFDVDPGFRRPDFGVIDGVRAAAPVTHHLSATYYDTPGTALAAAKITLRRRTGGPDEGWHLKLPAAAADSRRELREPLSDDLPAALAARVAGVAGNAPVVPIATLDTERTVVTLESDGSPVSSDGTAITAESTVVAEIADDSVTARRLPASGETPAGESHADGETLRWREIEVEVPRECPPVQEAVAALLLGAGARPASSASKLARLLAS